MLLILHKMTMLLRGVLCLDLFVPRYILDLYSNIINEANCVVGVMWQSFDFMDVRMFRSLYKDA